MFEIKARISDVDKYGEPGITPLFDVTDWDGNTVVLSVHELAILVRDAGQALAESVTLLKAAETKAALAHLASRSVE